MNTPIIALNGHQWAKWPFGGQPVIFQKKPARKKGKNGRGPVPPFCPTPCKTPFLSLRWRFFNAPFFVCVLTSYRTASTNSRLFGAKTWILTLFGSLHFSERVVLCAWLSIAQCSDAEWFYISWATACLSGKCVNVSRFLLSESSMNMMWTRCICVHVGRLAEILAYRKPSQS